MDTAAKPRSGWRQIAQVAETMLPLAASGTATLALVWAGAFYLIGNERAAVEKAVAESSRELAETYEAQSVRSLGAIDQTLKTVKYAWEHHGHGKVSLADLRAKGLLPPAFIFHVGIADSEGRVIDSTRARAADDIGFEPHFTAHRDRASGEVYVAQTIRSVNGDVSLSFSRRLDGPDGRFDGVVTVTVDPQYFTSGYEHSRLGAEGVLGLLGTDGIFRVRRSADRIATGDAIGAAVAARLADRDDGTSVVMTNPWDGVIRYTNARRLHGFPLIAVAGLSVDEQFAAFATRRRNLLLEAAAISAALLAAMVLLGRVSWQLARNRQRMRKVQETFFAASEASLDGFFLLRSVHDQEGVITDFVVEDLNSRAESLIAMSRRELLGQRLGNLFPEIRTNGVLAELVSVAATGIMREREWRSRTMMLSSLWLHRQVVRVEDGVVAIVRDITERKRGEILRAQQGRVLEMIASSTPLEEVLERVTQLVESQSPQVMGAVRLLGDNGRLQHAAAPAVAPEFIEAADRLPAAGTCSAAVERRAATASPDIGADPRWDALRTAAAAAGVRSCYSVPILSHEQLVMGTLVLYGRAAHEPTPVEVQVADMAARLAGIAIERRRTEERIRHMAHHDALTGLPNRNLLDDRLRQAMLHAQRYDHVVMVALIDLDNFKLVNDSLGHNVGDDLLCTVATRMTGCVRRTDTVARLGGDEFVIVLLDGGARAEAGRGQRGSAEGASDTLRKIADTIARPVKIGPHALEVTCSIGVAVYPHDGTDIVTLLRNADAAMYRAKELGHNRCEFYTAEMNQRIREKRDLQDGLRRAIANAEFRLLYQPQVDLASDRIVGVEALLRWERPGIGPVSPAVFIPLAEDTGQIVAIGDWVLHTACRQACAWEDAGLPPVKMSVNVSARQFREANLVERVRHALAESGLPPQRLELELTESAIMQDVQRAVTTMEELRALGVQLSIDDFGTGYSSLASLRRFPIGRLKIDRSFVHDVPDSEDGKAIAAAVISLGHQLKMRVIAEGVETTAQLDFLKANGCDEMQGYLYSKPTTADVLATLLSSDGRWRLGEAVRPLA